MRSSMALVVLLLCPLACAHGSTVQKLEFDTYRIAGADAPLDRRLQEAANNARDKRPYFVVRGISDVNSRGPSESPDIAFSSHRDCGNPSRLLRHETKAILCICAQEINCSHKTKV